MSILAKLPKEFYEIPSSDDLEVPWDSDPARTFTRGRGNVLIVDNEFPIISIMLGPGVCIYYRYTLIGDAIKLISSDNLIFIAVEKSRIEEEIKLARECTGAVDIIKPWVFDSTWRYSQIAMSIIFETESDLLIYKSIKPDAVAI